MTTPSACGTDALFLGIDLGTSSVKVVTINDRGQVLDSAAASYEVLAPRTGWAETHTQQWWDAVTAACREIPGPSRDRCAGVGLSGQMHGVVLADDRLRALRPALLHADTRAAAELERYRALPRHLLERLANPLSPNMAGPMLLWLARHEPAVLAQARWALQPKDWVRWHLTGSVAAEPSDASATLLYDVVGRNWDDEVVTALGIRRELLAPLCGSSADVAGALQPSAARILGLPAGIPVAAGGGDTAVAALGSGAQGRDATQLTIGTGGQVVTPLGPEAVAEVAHGTDPLRHPPVTHTYRDVADGWYAMAAVLNAGLALDWVRRNVAATWRELYACADKGFSEDTPLFVPHLTGERTPYLDPSLRASWSGLNLSHTRSDLMRAALEGVAFTLRDAVEALPGDSDGEALHVAGGGTQSQPWRQLLADVLGRPLRVLTVSGASSRGAAVLGALASGSVSTEQVTTSWSPPLGPQVEPRPQVLARVAERRARYRRTIGALHAP